MVANRNWWYDDFFLPGLETIPLKPGSGTLPIPGVEISVVDEFGTEVPPNTKGYLVIRKSLARNASNVMG